MDSEKAETSVHLGAYVEEPRAKPRLSNWYLKSAILFTEKAYELEEKYKDIFDSKSPNEKTEIKEEYFAYTSSSVIFSVAFIEACINEFYDHIISNRPSDEILIKLITDSPEYVQIFPSFISVMADKFDNLSILLKYDLALALFNKELINKGENPFSDVNLLIKLRNSLVHYKPEYLLMGLEVPIDEQHKLEKQLKGKFVLNPFFENSSNPFYPYKCLSYGCAYWSILSSYNFVEDFYSKFGLNSNFKNLIEELKSKK